MLDLLYGGWRIFCRPICLFWSLFVTVSLKHPFKNIVILYLNPLWRSRNWREAILSSPSTGQRSGNWAWIFKANWKRNSRAGTIYWEGKIYPAAVGYAGIGKRVHGDGVQIESRTGLHFSTVWFPPTSIFRIVNSTLLISGWEGSCWWGKSVNH